MAVRSGAKLARHAVKPTFYRRVQAGRSRVFVKPGLDSFARHAGCLGQVLNGVGMQVGGESEAGCLLLQLREHAMLEPVSFADVAGAEGLQHLRAAQRLAQRSTECQPRVPRPVPEFE